MDILLILDIEDAIHWLVIYQHTSPELEKGQLTGDAALQFQYQPPPSGIA